MSEISICNLALGWLGATLVTSVDGTVANITSVGQPSDLCTDNYANLRDAVLEEGKWTFATKRAKLTAEAVLPTVGYNNRFLFPSDALLIVAISDVDQPILESDTLDWRIEDGEIVTDAEIIYIKYIAQVTDTAKFTNTFEQAFITRLAADFAIPITRKKSIAETYDKKYERMISRARTMDGMQGKSSRLRSKNLTSRVR